jgi:hypothetical protein
MAWSGVHQLIAAGWVPRPSCTGSNRGRLHPLYRGVYAVGSPRALTREDAGWRHAGGRRLLSHRPPPPLWGVRPFTGPDRPLTTPRTRAKRPGTPPFTEPSRRRTRSRARRITVHHPRPAPLLDLAGVSAAPSAPAGHQRGRDPPPRRPAPPDDRHPTNAGTGALRALAPPRLPDRPRGLAFTTFLNDRRFPRPQTNTSSRGKRSTSPWPAQPPHHRARQLGSTTAPAPRSKTTAATDRRLKAAGWTVIRSHLARPRRPGRARDRAQGVRA